MISRPTTLAETARRGWQHLAEFDAGEAPDARQSRPAELQISAPGMINHATVRAPDDADRIVGAEGDHPEGSNP
jgi:hypothetical protein